MRSLLTTTAALIVALVSVPAALAQAFTTIDLRATATLPAGKPVLLQDVATLSGPDAQRLATLVLLHPDQATAANSDATAELTREAVRAALDRAPANWARTLLRGGGISLTYTSSPASQPASLAVVTQAPPATTGVEPSRSQAPGLAASTPAPAPAPQQSMPVVGSMKSLLIAALAEHAGVPIDAVILRIDALPAADQTMLESRIPSGWRTRIQVLGATPAGRTQVRIEAFENDRVPLSKTLTVEALVQRETIVAGPGGLARDQVIAADDLRLDTRLIPVNESARLNSTSGEQLVGKTLKRRIDQGKPVMLSDVASPALETAKPIIVVNRGDQVQVACLAGSVVVETRGTATSAAAVGQLVSIQIETTRPAEAGRTGKPGQPVVVKKIISARVSGPGRAVIDTDK